MACASPGEPGDVSGRGNHGWYLASGALRHKTGTISTRPRPLPGLRTGQGEMVAHAPPRILQSFDHFPDAVYGTFTAGQQELVGNDDRERRLAESGDSLLIFSYQAIAIPVEAGDAEVPPYGLI